MVSKGGNVMNKQILAALSVTLAGTSANAGVLVMTDGSTTTYNFPTTANALNSTFFNFNVGDPSALTSYAGFTRTGGLLQTGDTPLGAAPEIFGNAQSQ
jgi:hypothetical protein